MFESDATPDANEPASPIDLLGSHRHALDGKRRVAIPKAYRAAVQGAFEDESYVLCRQLGGDPCLALYPRARFDLALSKLERMKTASLGVGNKSVRSYLRLIRMSATPVAPDRQGRITLNEEQCRLAEIERDAVFVGCGDHAEVWSPARLQPTDPDVDFADLARELFG